MLIRGRRARRATRVLVALVVAGGLLVGCTHSSRSPEQDVAQRFLDAVGNRDGVAAARLTSAPDVAAKAWRASRTGLGAGAKGTLDVTSVHTTGVTSTVTFSAAWTLAGPSRAWRYTGHLPLRRNDGTWQITWAPSDLNPGLSAGQHLQLRRVQPPRAALNTRDGKPIFTTTPVVRVGVEPRLVRHIGSLARILAAVSQLQSSAVEIGHAASVTSHLLTTPPFTEPGAS